VVAGASAGIGAEFCRQIAAQGVNVVLVSRSAEKLGVLAAELSSHYGIDTRVAAMDLAAPNVERELFAATEDLDVGLLVYNAGADTLNTYFLHEPAQEWHAMVQRNCVVPLLASHHYGTAMVTRKQGGILFVTSGVAWAGGARLTTYGGTKAFDLVFGEGLWSELRRDEVDVLSLVVGTTDTPVLRAILARLGVSVDELAHTVGLADPADVVREGLTHLGDGPTWQVGVPQPAGGSPFGTLPRRQAVELMTKAVAPLFGD
jgi:short-subunit dehydrogenase